MDVSRWNLLEFNFTFDWDPLKRRSTRKTFIEYSPVKGLRESEITESTEKSPIVKALNFDSTDENVLSKRKVSSPPLADSSQSKHGKKD